METNSTFIAWLNDARGMEKSLVMVLETHAKLAKDHPEISNRIQQHAEETRRHAELVESCLTRLGGNVSTMKGVMGTLSGGLTGAASTLVGDDMMKSALADFASEHLEIASYTSLIAAAEQLGDEETAQVCRDILAEEQAMADWLEVQIPTLTAMYLEKGKTREV